MGSATRPGPRSPTAACHYRISRICCATSLPRRRDGTRAWPRSAWQRCSTTNWGFPSKDRSYGEVMGKSLTRVAKGGNGMNTTRLVGYALAGVVVLIFLGEMFGTVPAGFRGVVLRFGAPTGEVKMPGLYVVTPFVTHVALVNVQIQAYHPE